MSCKKCKTEKPIANKFHGLCSFCNNKRLEASKNKSKVNIPKSKKSVLKDTSVRLKRNVDPNKDVIKKKLKRKRRELYIQRANLHEISNLIVMLNV